MDLIETVRKLNRIGINLNQLAWEVHSLNFIDTKAYWENVEMANADCVIARNRLGQAMPPDHNDPGHWCDYAGEVLMMEESFALV